MPPVRPDARPRRLRPGPAWAVLVVLLAMPWQPVAAEEADRALQALLPPAKAAPERAEPLLKLEWDRRLRTADRLGPVPLRPTDQALLAAARAGRWDEVLALQKPTDSATPAADGNATDPAGSHALVLAAAAGQDAVLRALLQRGADIERRGDNGFTALGAAAFWGHRSAVRLLLRAGADPTRLGATGQTALHLASTAGHAGVVGALLQAGVPTDLLNAQRETALDLAAAANQAGVMDLLIQGGADLLMAGRR
ncbi:MAG: ankyrin repeat domain-containing protein [Aquabacterium sp.]|nr:ankyrin repeat domain-containing protein [Aquabacterium sp.]